MAQLIIRNLPQNFYLTAPCASGITIVFIHGWLLSGSYWLPLIELLQGYMQCLSYDLRGFGRSPTGNLPHTLVSYVEDLREMLDRLQLGKVWLMGHSLGGTIALWGGYLLGERVQGIICLNSGGGIYIHRDFQRLRLAGRIISYARPRWLLHLPWLPAQFTRDSVQTPLDLKWGKQRLLDLVSADLRSVLGILLDSTTEKEVHFLPQLVARLTQPVYFITGKQDQIMQTRFVKHLASFHYLWREGLENYWELDNCGHIAMLEQPQAVADLVLQVVSPQPLP
ncbi:MAG: alpha/beta fold hydrolase [Pseudanabaenaceae cyanobacterium]